MWPSVSIFKCAVCVWFNWNCTQKRAEKPLNVLFLSLWAAIPALPTSEIIVFTIEFYQRCRVQRVERCFSFSSLAPLFPSLRSRLLHLRAPRKLFGHILAQPNLCIGWFIAYILLQHFTIFQFQLLCSIRNRSISNELWYAYKLCTTILGVLGYCIF